jgi:hypothetical protein
MVQAVAVALVAKVLALRVTIEMTAMTAAANSNHRVLRAHARHKAKDVVALWVVACHNSPRAMPMSHVSHALLPVSLTPCAPVST